MTQSCALSSIAFPTDKRVDVCLVLRLRNSPSRASPGAWELQTELISDVYWPRTMRRPGSALRPVRTTVKAHPSLACLQLQRPTRNQISVSLVGQRLMVLLLVFEGYLFIQDLFPTRRTTSSLLLGGDDTFLLPLPQTD